VERALRLGEFRVVTFERATLQRSSSSFEEGMLREIGSIRRLRQF
jgi:hypothetical protein